VDNSDTTSAGDDSMATSSADSQETVGEITASAREIGTDAVLCMARVKSSAAEKTEFLVAGSRAVPVAQSLGADRAS
jgi:hypothetical protein